jgi:hypothetical protein
MRPVPMKPRRLSPLCSITHHALTPMNQKRNKIDRVNRRPASSLKAGLSFGSSVHPLSSPTSVSIPTGWTSLSPGLRGTSYPGWIAREILNPERNLCKSRPCIGARSIAPREFEDDRAEQCSALRISYAFAEISGRVEAFLPGRFNGPPQPLQPLQGCAFIIRPFTQGSSFLATLGCRTESLRDSKTPPQLWVMTLPLWSIPSLRNSGRSPRSITRAPT